MDLAAVKELGPPTPAPDARPVSKQPMRGENAHHAERVYIKRWISCNRVDRGGETIEGGVIKVDVSKGFQEAVLWLALRDKPATDMPLAVRWADLTNIVDNGPYTVGGHCPVDSCGNSIKVVDLVGKWIQYSVGYGTIGVNTEPQMKHYSIGIISCTPGCSGRVSFMAVDLSDTDEFLVCTSPPTLHEYDLMQNIFVRGEFTPEEHAPTEPMRTKNPTAYKDFLDFGDDRPPLLSDWTVYRSKRKTDTAAIDPFDGDIEATGLGEAAIEAIATTEHERMTTVGGPVDAPVPINQSPA